MSSEEAPVEDSTFKVSHSIIDFIFARIWFFTELFIIAIAMVYLVAENAHPNDTTFGQSRISRVAVWLGFFFSFVPLNLVLLDYYNSIDEESTKDKFNWAWVLINNIQIAFVWIISPLMIVYYEGNEKDTIINRVIKALKAQMPLFFGMAFFIIVTGFFTRKVYFPEDVAIRMMGDQYVSNYNKTDDEEVVTYYYMTETSYQQHILICTCFIGWLFFILFAGVGMTSLPWDLILDYAYRPKPIDEGNFQDRSKLLLQYALELRETGKKLDNERNYILQIKGIQGFNERRKFNSEMKRWEIQCMQCETEFKKLDCQTDYVKKVEPLKYTCNLLLGILCVLLSLSWLLAIALEVITNTLTKFKIKDLKKEAAEQEAEVGGEDAATEHQIFDLSAGIGGNIGVFSVDTVIRFLMKNGEDNTANIIFVLMGLYLTACVFKGNKTLGQRFSICSPIYYPMRSNETQLNSFMYNVFLLNVCSLPITLFCVELMPSYTINCIIFKYNDMVKYSAFMFWLTENNLVQKGALFMSLATIMLNVCKGGYRIKFSELDKKYRKEGKIGKNSMKRKDDK